MMRRAALLSMILLGGCGFQPLYGHLDGDRTDIVQQLQQVYVGNISDRYGQELRLALQEELGGASTQAPEGYTLSVSPSRNVQAVDIHSDNTAGRYRQMGSAHWILSTVSQNPKVVAQGDVSALDGYDATFEQYFAQTLNDETVRARLAKTLAGSIKQQIAIWFRTHNQPATEGDRGLPEYFDPNAMPTANGQPYTKAGPDGFPASATGRTDMNTGR